MKNTSAGDLFETRQTKFAMDSLLTGAHKSQARQHCRIAEGAAGPGHAGLTHSWNIHIRLLLAATWQSAGHSARDTSGRPTRLETVAIPVDPVHDIGELAIASARAMTEDQAARPPGRVCPSLVPFLFLHGSRSRHSACYKSAV